MRLASLKPYIELYRTRPIVTTSLTCEQVQLVKISRSMDPKANARKMTGYYEEL